MPTHIFLWFIPSPLSFSRDVRYTQRLPQPEGFEVLCNLETLLARGYHEIIPDLCLWICCIYLLLKSEIFCRNEPDSPCISCDLGSSWNSTWACSKVLLLIFMLFGSASQKSLKIYLEQCTTTPWGSSPFLQPEGLEPHERFFQPHLPLLSTWATKE